MLGSSRRPPDSVVGWGWGQPSPLSTPRRFRCLVLGASPCSPSTEAFPLFLLYKMTTGLLAMFHIDLTLMSCVYSVLAVRTSENWYSLLVVHVEPVVCQSYTGSVIPWVNPIKTFPCFCWICPSEVLHQKVWTYWTRKCTDFALDVP